MIALFDPLRDISFLSVFLRMVLAVICGGAIGIEREFKRRSAGFRTHILICLGAAMTTLTSQYLFLIMEYPTDIARLGAQVIAGIGFIGAGTIIVTKRQRVKGLTTAAGLWTCAIVGLAFGGGFYEAALITTVLILVAELFFSKLEHRIVNSSPEVNLYLEYSGYATLDHLLDVLKKNNVAILNMELTRSVESEEKNLCVIFYLRLGKKLRPLELTEQLNHCEGVKLVQEL